MNNSVVIKGNKHGIVVVLDENTGFEDLRENIIEKFRSASKFFDKANMAISFEGRKLTPEQEREILDIISKESDLNIVCVIDNDQVREQYFKASVEQKMNELSSQTGQFYKGTLRSGQVLEAESSIIILGDVNPGGKVIAKGNVVVLGSLKGNIYAGANGNEDAFVVALEMNPMQIRIGDIIARCSDGTGISKDKSKKNDPRIAYVEDGNIYIEKLDKDVLDDIRM